MRQANRYLARAAMLLATAAAVLGHTGAVRAQGENDAVDYVRVCDAYGSGYFFIPGTETCLRIGGYVRYNFENSENTNHVGTGVVRYGAAGDEPFGGTFGKRVVSHGIGLGGYITGDYGDLRLGKFPVVGAYFGYDGTWGEEEYSSSVMVGYDNVTLVGLVFAHPDISGNGPSSPFMGDGLDSSGSLDRDRHRVNLGMKVRIFDSGRTAEEPGAGSPGISKVTGRIGVFYEGRNLDAYGMSDMTRGGMPLPGYYQNFTLDTEDRYFGLQLGTKVDFDPCFDERLTTSLSADLFLGYHSGSGHFRQETGVGVGSVVVQMQDYSDSGFSIGAELAATTTYKFSANDRLSTKLKWNITPDVTSYYQRSNPSGGVSHYSSESEQSWGGSIRYTRTF